MGKYYYLGATYPTVWSLPRPRAVEPGAFKLMVGGGSDAIQLTGMVHVGPGPPSCDVTSHDVLGCFFDGEAPVNILVYV